MNDQQIIGIKQYLIMDGISRILSIIEGLLILLHSLSEGYSSVTTNMISYKTSLVGKVRDNILSRTYNMKKILAFLPVDELPLSKEEKNTLIAYYEESEKTAYEILDALIEFREKYSIIYNKSKHGMTISAGGHLGNSPKDFRHSSLIAYDHKNKEEEMPRGYYRSVITEPSDQYWFNVQSHLNFNTKLFSDMSNVIGLLQHLSNYIVDNHLNYANNCGETYLPYEKLEEGKYSIKFLISPNFNEKQDIVDSITKKIISNMIISDYFFEMNSNFTEQKLVNAVIENSITNIFITGKEKTK
jgi:hypothetical protein